MKEAYKVLGLTEDATSEQVDEAYKRLKTKYSRDRFLEGEAGNVAAKKLTKVEDAYAEIILNRYGANQDNYAPTDFSEIENLIKKGDISGAQKLLDDSLDKNAEWHYLQSVVFYKKNWINESKKQLEIAMNMDASCEKYAKAYAILKEKTEFNEKHFSSNTQSEPVYENRQMGDTNFCANYCASMCCMNLMLNLCCGCR